MKLIEVKLKDISTPKQWKNLPVSKLDENGKYKVYGANGVIGYYNEYNHEFPTIAITCRGATCGSIHLTEPNSYITSNAMALDNLDTSIVDIEFLKYVLKRRGFQDVITGSAQPQITAINLKKIKLTIPENLEEQRKIVNLLSQIETLIQKREKSIELLDKLVKSTFLDMFGDPFSNQKGFEIGTIRDLVTEVKYGTGNKASTVGKYSYLRMNNIDYNGYWNFNDLKYIDIDDSEKEKYLIKKGDLVFNRTNSKELVGKTAVYNQDKEMIIAGYLIRVRVNEESNPYFIWGYLNSYIGKKVLLNLCRNIVGMANINAQELQKIKIHKPSKELQDEFAEIVIKIENTKKIYQNSLDELKQLFGSVSQKSFKGELDLSKIELELEVDKPIELIEPKKEKIKKPKKKEKSLLNSFSNIGLTIGDKTLTTTLAKEIFDNYNKEIEDEVIKSGGDILDFSDNIIEYDKDIALDFNDRFLKNFIKVFQEKETVSNGRLMEELNKIEFKNTPSFNNKKEAFIKLLDNDEIEQYIFKKETVQGFDRDIAFRIKE